MTSIRPKGRSRSQKFSLKTLSLLILIILALLIFHLETTLQSSLEDQNALGAPGDNNEKPEIGKTKVLSNALLESPRVFPEFHSQSDFKTVFERRPPAPLKFLTPKLGKTEVANAGPSYHIVFSTDCSAFQRWQSYLLFHQAMKIKQPGKITRIASGCSESESENEQKWHDEFIAGSMSADFYLHLTPKFSTVKIDGQDTDQNYEYFNKPFGLRHWIEYGAGMGMTGDGVVANEDMIIILIDPDMVLLRPITNDFSNESETLYPNRYPFAKKTKVEHGKPFAQKYGLGAQWRSFDLDKIAGKDSPAKLVSSEDGNYFYPAGPPYIATLRDMYKIAVKWSDFAPEVHRQYPHLLAEMYAYCIAAAHLNLPHQMIASLMVSNTLAGDEGWKFIDDIADKDIVKFASDPDHSVHPVPSVLHHCQRYMLGKSFFGKRKVPPNIFNCEMPLLKPPPMELLTYDYRIPPPVRKGGPGGERVFLKSFQAKRDAFMICAMTQAVNDASTFFKSHHCKDPNMSKDLDLWEGF